MLNISDPMSPEALASYHDSPHDYLIADSVAPSKWGGNLAPEFGLSGEVQKQHFERLLYGRDPFSNEKLKPGKDGNRGGHDITFSAPKELSLAYLRLRQTDPKAAEQLLNEFLQSTEQSMAEMEQEAATQKKNPKRWEKTGNWLWARYLHLDSRPDEKTGMPVIQIHAHYVVFNLTKADVGMRAIELGYLKGSFKSQEGTVDHHMAEWHSDLARRMREMGAGIKRTKSIGFGIEGVSRELVDKWSPRRATIKEAKRRILEAMDDPEKRAELVAKYHIEDWDAFKKGVAKRLQGELAKITRKHKQKNLSREELWEYWYSQLTKSDKKMLDSIWGRKGWETTPYEALKYGLDHNLYRASTVSEKQVLIDALRYGVGSVTTKALKAEYRKLGVLVKDGKLTTEKVYAQENRITGFAEETRGTMRPVLSKEQAKLALDRLKSTTRLSSEQLGLMHHVLTSPDQVMLIVGDAGTGKTTADKPLVSILEQNGYRVAKLAPSADASRIVLAKDFKDANTVESFKRNAKWHTSVDVALVDEATFMSIDDTEWLFNWAKEGNRKIILQGDPKQHRAVARDGNLFYILENYANLPVARLTETYRFKDKDVKAVAAAFVAGKPQEAVNIMEKRNWVHHVEPDEVCKAVADIWFSYKDKGIEPIVSGITHNQIDRVTEQIRAKLKEKGELQGEVNVGTLKNLGWSDAQKMDFGQYDGTEVIQLFKGIEFVRDGQKVKLKAGDKATVADLIAEKQYRHRPHRGPKSTKPGLEAKDFAVFATVNRAFAAHDKVRFTAGGWTLPDEHGKKHRINNGQTGVIKSISVDGQITLENGWKIASGFGHITHDYLKTSLKGQGRTKYAGISVMTKEAGKGVHAAQSYVDLTRGEYETRIVTDLKKVELIDRMKRKDERKSATELLGRPKKRKHKRKFMKRVAETYRRLRERAAEVIQDKVQQQREWGYAR